MKNKLYFLVLFVFLVSCGTLNYSCGSLNFSCSGSLPDNAVSDSGPIEAPDSSIPDASPPKNPDSGTETVPDSGTTPTTPTLNTTQFSSHWHPDSDDDGVVLSEDDCPSTYNPKQLNECASFGLSGEFISDLRVEHVTPYGAWFGYTSPVTPTYDTWDAAIVWSTDKDDVSLPDSAAQTAFLGSVMIYGESAPRGVRNTNPVILDNLQPGTTYYASVYRRTWDDRVWQLSNTVEFTTKPEVSWDLSTTHPYLIMSSPQLSDFKSRYNNGDEKTVFEVNKMKDMVSAIVAGRENYVPYMYCPSAALVYHATGDSNDLANALNVFNKLLTYYQNTTLRGNDYRYVAGELPACVDLLWGELTSDQKNDALRATLEDDLYYMVNGYRMGDTDQFTSFTQAMMYTGLLACGESEFDPELSEQACAVLDYAKRKWFGTQMVKARRDSGKFAQSGGYLPDGNYYGQGTVGHWLEMLIALHNVGYDLNGYVQFVRGSFRALFLDSMSPSGQGYLTIGDTEDFGNPSEPGSAPVGWSHAGPIGAFVAFFRTVGDHDFGGYAARFLDNSTQTNKWVNYWNAGFNSSGYSKSNSELPTIWVDTGFGLVFDRTSWNSDASLLFYRSGWGGVDHTHADQGGFQFYRKGEWLTHESAGYLGKASKSYGHNVLQLDCPGEALCPYHFDPYLVEGITSVYSNDKYTYIESDNTGAYNRKSVNYTSVTRDVFWLKGNKDILVFYDEVHGDTNSINFLLQLNQTATVTEGKAVSVTDSGQYITVKPLFPTSGWGISVSAPEGHYSDYPTPVHTHTVSVSYPGQTVTPRTAVVFSDTEVNIGYSNSALVVDNILIYRSVGTINTLQTSGATNIWVNSLQPNKTYNYTVNNGVIDFTQGDNEATTDSAGVLNIRL